MNMIQAISNTNSFTTAGNDGVWFASSANARLLPLLLLRR